MLYTAKIRGKATDQRYLVSRTKSLDNLLRRSPNRDPHPDLTGSSRHRIHHDGQNAG